jgi:hypothetical protein
VDRIVINPKKVLAVGRGKFDGLKPGVLLKKISVGDSAAGYRYANNKHGDERTRSLRHRGIRNVSFG